MASYYSFYKGATSERILDMEDYESSESNDSPQGPPPAPPRVKFFPPLFLQRRAKVHSLVRELSTQLCELRSLLDVGCGTDAILLRTMTAPDADFPLEVLTGIDIDDEVWTEGVRIAFGNDGDKDEEDRWRNLTVNLVHGSFTNLSKNFMGEYDVITACEVIEHLDPEILDLFSPVLLGRMRPKVFIVTTPNREFNRMFEMSFKSLDRFDPESLEPYTYDPLLDPKAEEKRYYRDNVPYAMRHHDHRFEWTRAEFEKWAEESASTHGYKLHCYEGCGRLGDGMQFKGNGWDVAEALKREIIDAGEKGEISDLNGTMLKVFGHCTQIAVFVRPDVYDSKKQNEEEETRAVSYELPHRLSETLLSSLNGVSLVKSKEYKANDTSPYPPSAADLLDLIEAVSLSFLPMDIISQWTDDKQREKEEEEELGNHSVAVVETDMKKLWERSVTIQRLCRGSFPVFLNTMGSPEGSACQSYNVTSTTLNGNDLMHVHYKLQSDNSEYKPESSKESQTEDSNDEKDEEEEEKKPDLAPDKSVKIETKLIWPINSTAGQALDPIQLATDDDLKGSPTLRCAYAQSASPDSPPLLMIFYRPEVSCDTIYSDSLNRNVLREELDPITAELPSWDDPGMAEEVDGTVWNTSEMMEPRNDW